MLSAGYETCAACGSRLYEAEEIAPDTDRVLCFDCLDAQAEADQADGACARRAQAESPQPKYRVCPLCLGEGMIVNRALSVWTEADRDADPDGFEDMRSGRFDVGCPRCGGQRVVTAADDDRWRESEDDRRTMLMEDGIGPGHADYY